LLHHLSFADLKTSSSFYDAVLGALGYRRAWTANDAVGYGLEEQKDLFTLKHRGGRVAAPIA
jgi:hypothetical protein